MASNPYKSPTTSDRRRHSQPTRWMVRTGGWLLIVSLLLGVGGTTLSMVKSFQVIAESTDAPRPSDLADDIAASLIWTGVTTPFAIIGLILVVVGYVRRRPADGDSGK